MLNAPEGMQRTQEGTFISFEWSTKKNNYLSEQEGRPVFETVLLMQITIPGAENKTPSAISRMVHEVERHTIDGRIIKNKSVYDKYKEYIERFKADEEFEDLGGTPIQQWPQIDQRRATVLKAMGVLTVEALVDLPDGNLSSLGMGARELQAKAKAWLEMASKSADVQKYAAENVRLRADVDTLKKQIEELSAVYDRNKITSSRHEELPVIQPKKQARSEVA